MVSALCAVSQSHASIPWTSDDMTGKRKEISSLNANAPKKQQQVPGQCVDGDVRMTGTSGNAAATGRECRANTTPSLMRVILVSRQHGLFHSRHGCVQNRKDKARPSHGLSSWVSSARDCCVQSCVRPGSCLLPEGSCYCPCNLFRFTSRVI